MNIVMNLLAGCVCVLVVGTGCNRTDDNPPNINPGTAPAIVGHWIAILPPIAEQIPDFINIDVAITWPDSLYRLLAIFKTSGDTALDHRGTWSATPDTIILHGTRCAIIDTSTKTMRLIDDATCAGPSAIPFALQTRNADSFLTIPLSELGMLAAALNINPSAIPNNVDVELMKIE